MYIFDVLFFCLCVVLARVGAFRTRRVVEYFEFNFVIVCVFMFDCIVNVMYDFVNIVVRGVCVIDVK